MKNLIGKRILALFLTLMLVLGCFLSFDSVTVFAKTSSSDVPDTLEVYVKYKSAADYKLLKSYSVSDFKGIGTSKQMYSFIDQLPTVVYAEAEGVSLSEIIADLGFTENQVGKITYNSTDGASRSGTLSSWSNGRFYFPNLSEVGWEQNEKGKIEFSSIDEAMAGAESVEPMLAVTIVWKRVPSQSSFDQVASNEDSETRFRFMMGQKESDVKGSRATASETIKWINEMKIDVNIPDPEGTTTDHDDKNSSNDQGSSGSGGSGSSNKDKDNTSDHNNTNDSKDNAEQKEAQTSTASGSIPVPDITAVKGSLQDLNGHWAETSIYEMVAMGAINGYQDRTFKPSNTVTRAEFTSMLLKALVKTGNATLDDSVQFDDTKNHWASSYISTAAKMGIVSGYSDAKFGPNDVITREQMAVMMNNAMKFSSGQNPFSATDSAQFSSWSKEAVKALADNRIMTADLNGVFRPKDNANRAEAAEVIYRSLEKKGYVKS